MASAPDAHKDQLTRLYTAVQSNLASGVVATTQKVRLRYWVHWQHFCSTQHQLDPFLESCSQATRAALTTGFAQHVRQGDAGRGHQVRHGSVQAALSAIGAICELDSKWNVTYVQGCHGVYHKTLRELLASYKKADPKSKPKLAVPVGLTKYMVRKARHHKGFHRAKHQAIADLTNIAFYYLLRVGEYTRQPTGRQTETFIVANVTFRDAQHNIIPNNSSWSKLKSATEATLRIGNQKNGIKGETIHVECTGTKTSPIRSLARRVHHILSNGGSESSFIYIYYLAPDCEHYIDTNDINQTLKKSAKAYGLFKLGYEKGDVSSHSLRAGGAMAMHLNKCSDIQIRKMGRWRSDTFLMYIHEQITAFSIGVSKLMSTDIEFRPVTGPRLRPPPVRPPPRSE